jgi:hypothetical protein
MKVSLLPFLLLALALVSRAEEATPAPFKLIGMKAYSDKIENKAEIGKDGVKIEGGVRVGNISQRGSEITDLTFPETQRKQYFDFTFGSGSAGREVKVNLVSKKTSAGLNRRVLSLAGKIDDKGTLPAEWSLENDWPVGLYNVVFVSDGQVVGSGGYLVKATPERETPVTAGEVTIYSVRDGKEVEMKDLKPSDNNLVFACATKGAFTAGATVRMWLERVDKDGGAQEIQPTVMEVKEWPLDDTNLVYKLELPGAMPVGTFNVVFAVNGKELKRQPFSVKE